MLSVWNCIKTFTLNNSSTLSVEHDAPWWSFDPTRATPSHLIQSLNSNQFSEEFCWRMKSKLKFFLVLYSILYGVLKFLQFTIYFYSVLNKILDDDCNDRCVAEYSEIIFIVCMFVPLSFFIYGVSQVCEGCLTIAL